MPIITIARGSLWGGQAVADMIAQELGCPCIGREALMGEALNLTSATGGPMEDPSQISALWDRLSWDRGTYLSALQAALASHAVSGNLVYHGLAGHLLLRHIPRILRVRIIAPLEARIEIVARKENVGREEAEAYIRKVDEEWRRWTRFVFDVDWHDPSLYDLVVNLEKLDVGGACATILEAVKRPEFEITDEIREQIQDLALASRVKLVLAMVPASMDMKLEVSAKRGEVMLKGQAPADLPPYVIARAEGFLAAVVGQTQGVLSVAMDLSQSPDALAPEHPSKPVA